MKKIFTSLVLGLIGTTAIAQWSPTSMQGERIRTTSNVKSYYSLDLTMMRSKLATAHETGKSAKPVEIKLPTLDGKVERFAVYSSPVVAKSLEDRYQLGSYVGVGIDDPTAYVRFSVSPNDFQSMMLRKGVYEFIEPQNTSKSVYGVHPKTNKSDDNKAFFCSTNEEPLTKKQMDQLYKDGSGFSNNAYDFKKSSDKKYRTMRLAMSVTGEYTNYFGGVEGAITAINATMTRSNFVFEKDFGLHLILQDFPELIYTDPATDPYSPAASGSGGAWNLELQKTLTNVIGNDAYDIGHLFGATGGGGNAGCIGCVCVNPASASTKAKGSGFTSPADGKPFGDNFDVDYVAHEMGHQLGANHTFSMSTEGTGQNVEPGSGSTIMGYAGITGATDVQPHSDAYFHINSIIQVQNNLISKTCDIETPIDNNPPVITPMPDVTIPKGTAFVLTAQATDAENNPLNYTWEEVDNATAAITKTNLGTTTNGASFRSIMGTASPTRFFPKLETVMAGTLSNPNGWEAVSSVARVSNFRVTVRDNNPDVAQQQTQQALQKVTVNANGPFKITSSKVYNNAAGPLTWDVVGTNAAPFNVSDVKVDYTTDNGLTWTVLSESTPNDGSEDFSFASFATNTALKVRISAIGNVFYAVAPVTVSAIVPCDGTAPAGLAVSTVTNATANLNWDPIAGATYKVRYKKVADATWSEAASTTTTYAIIGLTEGTAYEAQVAGVCSGNPGLYSASVNFTTTVPSYCAAGATSTSFEKINNITFANINNSSTGTAGYEDFTAVSGNVTKGTTYTFTATSNSSYATDEIRVWIDFNGDKDFDDEGEFVLQSDLHKSPWTGSITIPEDAKSGPTRMRVRLQDSSYNPNNGPCGNSQYGQVEDYTIEINGLAVGESGNKVNVQVYPNPATDVLNISKVNDKAGFIIYNMAGQAVNKGKIVNGKVQVSQLQKGVYIIAVDNDGELTKVKFIKK
ncbi:T9SS type A sorting domain-containing protein [Kaistella flava (ex Peng et al. 2021)]|uniref:T9SS type A sorting domain-containing protein n=1 Tax=Kaistella flava (ex Peng et al. 2021) TaxID=2038776 RepID=A0A7M2YCF1_9FLAO|nr:M12 family metallo-peptidase [Kaistella flava (ex Peng et al. 2021)]QOW11499.1 T9SS type A sorting domain-containing protein [Kaistella flava (ex Peng et al. 2021)]